MDLRTFFCDAYAAAFSAKDVGKVLPFYKPNAVLTFHQYGGDLSGKGGAGGDVSAYTGGAVAALLRGKLPAALMLSVVFKRLKKRGYHRSTVSLKGTRVDGDRTLAWIEFERFTTTGALLEKSQAVYRVERAGEGWCISEAWLFDSPEQAPSSLALDRFT